MELEVLEQPAACSVDKQFDKSFISFRDQSLCTSNLNILGPCKMSQIKK